MKRILSQATTVLSFGILLAGCVSPGPSYGPYDPEPYYYDSNEYNEFDMGYVTSGDYYPSPDYYPYNYDYTYTYPSYSNYRNHHWNSGGYSRGAVGVSFHRR